MKTLKCLAIIGLGTLLLASIGCSTNPVTGKDELILISPEQEIAMGVEAGPEFEKEFGGKVANQQVQQYVQKIGKTLAAASDREMPYEYTALNSDIPNAFALPGGKIYITSGLLKAMQNERELAGVLGHETAHVAAKHNVKNLQRQMTTSVLVNVAGSVIGGTAGQAAEAGAKIASSMVNLSYSRGDEYEADLVGIRYMEKAGYNPYGMVEMLTTLMNLNEKQPGSFTEFFHTHPLTTKRIDEARQYVEDEYGKYSSKTPDPNQADFLEIRSMLP